MNILPSPVYVFHMCTWYPQRPEKTIRSPGTVVIGDYNLSWWSWELSLEPVQKEQVRLAAETSLWAPNITFLIIHSDAAAEVVWQRPAAGGAPDRRLSYAVWIWNGLQYLSLAEGCNFQIETRGVAFRYLTKANIFWTENWFLDTFWFQVAFVGMGSHSSLKISTHIFWFFLNIRYGYYLVDVQFLEIWCSWNG